MNSSDSQNKVILFISELPENTKQSELEIFFHEFKNDIHMMQIDTNQKIYDIFNARKPKATIIFKTHEKAAEARSKLNMKRLKGKALNIMWHERDNSVRYNNKANLFVKAFLAMRSQEKYMNYLKNMEKLFRAKYVKMTMEIY